jgi:uncharacterized protein (DUF1778 family)
VENRLCRGNLVALICYPIGRTSLQDTWRPHMARTRGATARKERRLREARLGIRVDGRTKQMVARAAELERRSLTDFCLTALTEAARRTIARHEMLVLSERDQQIFFDALIHPPKPNAKLTRAFKSERERLAP